ncbi:hypothetical protein Golax_019700 [Gossypium laxum]|uniref:Uncharacterized protein n=1 Tax=Gossypium laxum TaxID=34288 RepID=A0A7J8Z7B4_9ROSI|nr:hypothetical protein [Gossypium laxum]
MLEDVGSSMLKRVYPPIKKLGTVMGDSRRYGPSQKIRLAKTRANLEEDIVMEQPLNNATMVIPDKSEKYGP